VNGFVVHAGVALLVKEIACLPEVVEEVLVYARSRVEALFMLTIDLSGLHFLDKTPQFKNVGRSIEYFNEARFVADRVLLASGMRQSRIYLDLLRAGEDQ